MTNSDPPESPEAILARLKPLTSYANSAKEGFLMPDEVDGRFFAWSVGAAVALAILTAIWGKLGISGFLLPFFAGILPFLILAGAARSLKRNWPRYLAHISPPRLGSDSIRRRQATARIILRTTPFLIGIVLFANGQFFSTLARLNGGKSVEQIKRPAAPAKGAFGSREFFEEERANYEAFSKKYDQDKRLAARQATLDSLRQAGEPKLFRGVLGYFCLQYQTEGLVEARKFAKLEAHLCARGRC